MALEAAGQGLRSSQLANQGWGGREGSWQGWGQMELAALVPRAGAL